MFADVREYVFPSKPEPAIALIPHDACYIRVVILHSWGIVSLIFAYSPLSHHLFKLLRRGQARVLTQFIKTRYFLNCSAKRLIATLVVFSKAKCI
jgi:hypothetical protein